MYEYLIVFLSTTEFNIGSLEASSMCKASVPTVYLEVEREKKKRNKNQQLPLGERGVQSCSP